MKNIINYYHPIWLNDQTQPETISPKLSRLRRASLGVAITWALLCLTLSSAARAACQQGCSSFANTFLGEDALINNISSENTAIGSNALGSNDVGDENTAVGAFALFQNESGIANTATGDTALFGNVNGSNNTATGSLALESNNGSNNTATGFEALVSNSDGNFNTAIGADALANNDADNNTATGFDALELNVSGHDNTANGLNALIFNDDGSNNTATGSNALFSNTSGINNTASGSQSLFSNTTGSGNIAVGESAGINLTTGSNNIDIANRGVAGDSNTIRIGRKNVHTNTYIWGISGVVVPNGVGVIVGNNGHLGTVVCSARYKDRISPMDKASEAILGLNPVTFRYKKEFDPEGIPQFGLVAEEVEKIDPNLVAHDNEGKPYTVRYEAVNAMLLNEFLKEHRKVEDQVRENRAQEETIDELKSALAQQQKEIKALSAGLQKVSNRVELMKPAARIVANQ